MMIFSPPGKKLKISNHLICQVSIIVNFRKKPAVKGIEDLYNPPGETVGVDIKSEECQNTGVLRKFFVRM